jgi:hypothetical protein
MVRGVPPRIELRHDLRVDLPVTAGLAVVVVGWRLLRDDLEPSTCRWCDGSSPGKVNAIDDWFRSRGCRRVVLSAGAANDGRKYRMRASRRAP